MLKGIAPCIGPDLLRTLAEMGHGDEIVLADAHFPAHSLSQRVIRMDGVGIPPLLEGILGLFPLDTYDQPLIMMAPVEGDTLDPAVESSYVKIANRHEPDAPGPVRIDRYTFYERARTAMAIVVTGDTRQYANIILKKGVIRP